MPQCHLCGCEYSREDDYCSQCGAALNGKNVALNSPEWITTAELLELSKILSSTFDLQLLLKKIDDSAVKLTEATAGAVMLFDDDKKALKFRSSSGEKAKAVRSIPVNDGIAWWVGQKGAHACVDDTSSDRRFTGAVDRITGFNTKNLLCVPVVMDDKTIGVIEVLNKENSDGFTDHDEQMLSVLTGQAAVAIKNTKLATEQRNFFNHVIEILVMAIESTGLVPEGHCWRVAKMTTAIGRELGMQEQELQDLYHAAALHDLGVLKLRENIDLDRNQMKSHPALGAIMVKDIDMLRGTESIIRNHHEYVDGSGYPDGLKDDEIPCGSKIISMVEVYEKDMAENGSRILTEASIQASSGKLFDPAVVNAFLRLMDLNQWLSL